MAMNFTGKRVLITGGTVGVGRMAAELFCGAGAAVAIHAPTRADAELALGELGNERIAATTGDIATVAGCETVVREAVGVLGGLDVLVNSAEIAPLARLMEVTGAMWDAVFAANLRSAMFCTRAALPALRASHGSIVMVSSVAAMMAGPTDRLLYSTSKAGLIGMTRNLAIELAPDRIRVNCVAHCRVARDRRSLWRANWQVRCSIGSAGSARHRARMRVGHPVPRLRRGGLLHRRDAGQ
jgi:3-oxoacyl-[acyl-carrier protein] reductase